MDATSYISGENIEVGDVVWAKVDKAGWWPGILIEREDCRELQIGGNSSALIVYWFGDGRVSRIVRNNIIGFREGYENFCKKKRSFNCGVYQAITEYRKLQYGLDIDWNMTKAEEWAFCGFPIPKSLVKPKQRSGLSRYIRDKLSKLTGCADDDNEETSDTGSNAENDITVNQINVVEEKEKEENHELADIKLSGAEIALKSDLQNGKVILEEFCLACFTVANHLTDHPMFSGKICMICKNKYLNKSYAVGLDGVSYFCSLCLELGQLVVCSKPDCFRAFCTKCMSLKAAPGSLEIIWNAESWHCFLCAPYDKALHGYLRALRQLWKRNMLKMFHSFELHKLPALRVLCMDGSSMTACAVLPKLSAFAFPIEEILLSKFTSQDVKKLKNLVFFSFVEIDETMKDLEIISCLSSITPIHIVVGKVSGKDYLVLNNILLKLRALNPPGKDAVPVLYFLEAADPSEHLYHKLVTRYLECEAGIFEGKVTWTNIPVLWLYLEGAGLPKIIFKRQNGERKRKRGRISHPAICY